MALTVRLSTLYIAGEITNDQNDQKSQNDTLWTGYVKGIKVHHIQLLLCICTMATYKQLRFVFKKWLSKVYLDEFVHQGNGSSAEGEQEVRQSDEIFLWSVDCLFLQDGE